MPIINSQSHVSTMLIMNCILLCYNPGDLLNFLLDKDSHYLQSYGELVTPLLYGILL